MASEETKTVTFQCRTCLKDVTFELSAEDLAGPFPITKDDVHGDPPHRFVVKINANLELESFEVEEHLPEGPQITRAVKVAEEVLSQIGLSERETSLYFRCTGLGPVTLGEMALLAGLSVEEMRVVVDRFVEMGLFKSIPGAREYFQALPPYAAIIDQLDRFGEFISTIQRDTPEELSASFERFEREAKGVQDLNDFVAYLTDIKEEISQQMEYQRQALASSLETLTQQQEVIDFISKMRRESGALIDRQVEALAAQAERGNELIDKSVAMLNEQFERLSQELDRSLELVDAQIAAISDQFDSLQSKITGNLKKLRLGVILKTVEDIVSKVFARELEEIKKSFQEQFVRKFQQTVEGLKVSFREQFIQTFQEEFGEPFKAMVRESQKTFQSQFGEPIQKLLEQLSTRVEETAKNAGVVGEDIQAVISAVLTEFDNTLRESQLKISGVSEKVLASFRELRNTFSEKVLATLKDVLDRILDKLAGSSTTVEEFWEEAKRVIKFTMQDVWFVRTPEGMKAQIIDICKRAKSRILIIAPTLSDVEIEPLFKISRHINIRVCCSVDPGDEEDRQVLDYLAVRPNIVVRHRELQNLWGISRDYEEIITGIVSKSEGEDGKEVLEVVGIGSVIDEHIKIFEPILADAWVGAKKNLGYTPKPTPPPGIDLTEEPVEIPDPYATAKKAREVVPARERLLPVQEAETEPSTTPAPEIEYPADPDENISARMDAIESQIDRDGDSATIAQMMEELRDFVFENKGFSTVLNEIRNWASQVKRSPTVEGENVELLKKQLSKWRETLVGTPATQPPAGAGEEATEGPTPAPPTVSPEPSVPARERSEPAAPKSEILAAIHGNFDELLTAIDALKPGEFATRLEKLKDQIFENVGFSTILREMNAQITKLKKMKKWDDATKDLLKERLPGWKGKVH